MKLTELVDYTGQLLDATRFRDYGPNGLQVEGKQELNRLVTGVSASLRLLEAAADLHADAVLVHHGWFWKSEDVRVVGVKRKRMAFLMQHDMSLIGYHLPLDAHLDLGNNVLLGKKLGLEIDDWFGEQRIAAHGRLAQPKSLGLFCADVEIALQRKPFVVGEFEKTIRRIAWCSGAAQDYLAQAVELGVDAFLTGEVSEHTVHLARESGVAFIAAGHHATERYGVQALGQHLAQRFSLQHEFIDIDNPI